MEPARKSDTVIDAEACDWVVRLEDREYDPQDPHPDPTERYAAYRDWMRESARHVRAFIKAVEAFHALDAIDVQRRINVDRLLAEESSTVIQLRPDTSTRLPRGEGVPKPAERLRSVRLKHLSWVAMCAVAFLIAMPLWLHHIEAATVFYETGIGGSRIAILEDGSEMRLNTRTRATVQFTRYGRIVRLLEGEALFSVAHHPQRPFLVFTDDMVIRDVGTQFDVYRRPTGTTVSLVEGEIRVALREAGAKIPTADMLSAIDTVPYERIIQAGTQAAVIHDGAAVSLRVTRESALQLANRVAWQDGMLNVQGERLSEVVAELNRYNRRQLVINDRTTGDKLLGGHFRLLDPDAFADAIVNTFGVSILPSDPKLNIIRIGQ